AEMDNFIAELEREEKGNPADDQIFSGVEGPAVSRLGDVWLLGDHKIYCGDSRSAESFEKLLGPEKAQMIFTDPPYNVPIHGNVGGLGKVRHREFAMAAGEMSSPAFTRLLQSVFRHLVAFSVNGAIHFICMDWRHVTEILNAGSDCYTELKNLCV